MIKLSVANGRDSPALYSFDQSLVTIGSETSPSADIAISSKGLRDNHIQIALEGCEYYAINSSNDPFASLNGKPFGKRKLHDKDIISLHQINIQIDIEKRIPEPMKITEIKANNSLILQDEGVDSKIPAEEVPINIDELISQVEELAEGDLFKKIPLSSDHPDPVEGKSPPIPAPAAPPENKEAPPYPSKTSLKDYYLSEYDDIPDEQSPLGSSPQQPLAKTQELFITENNWTVYLKIFSALMCIFAICSGLAYLWISDRSDQEEINAAKAIADVAMALTYAQLKEIQPQNHNWTDPEFIKNNLTAVLASSYPSLANFDAHGHFANCPYLLRIYTSGDLTQFWVIAQPAPSLLQWLIPKSTIILDSNAMEMRKIKDLKSLNRLLVNALTLESNSGEVSALVRQGVLIPLATLVDKNENLGFSTPKALALIRPGAENLVYNAPRYYLLGEELMKKAIDLLEKPASSHEVALLQQEISALSKFPNAVFYSSEGIQNAIQDQKALATLAPNDKFLVAYLQFNAQGHVASSHLLMDDTPADIVSIEPFKASIGHHHVQNMLEEENSEASQPGAASAPDDRKHLNLDMRKEVDEDNPLFLQLSALGVFRQQALRPINDEIINLLNKETQCAQPLFATRFPQLVSKYNEVSKEQQAKIMKKLDAIYRENTHLPAAEFLNFAKVAGLQEFLKEYISGLKQQLRSPEVSQEQIEKKLLKIEKAANWQELEQQLAETVELLSLDRIPDEENIIAYQNATRSRIIQKLNQFLLSSDHSLPFQAFDPEYKYSLIHILKMGWITDPDTSDFYLGEFELRSNLPRRQSDDQESGLFTAENMESIETGR